MDPDELTTALASFDLLRGRPEELRDWRTGAGAYEPIELRGVDGGTGDGSFTMHGYAAVFDSPTTLYDGKSLRITEDIAPGAFTAALEDPALLVHFNHGHEMRTAIATTDVAANEIGGLELSQTTGGLRYFARTDRDDPDASSLAVKMRRKIIKGASFAFRIGQEDRTESEDEATGKRTVHYRINQVSKLFDVCACAQGAYPQASSNVRSALEALDGRITMMGHDQRRADLAGVTGAASPGSDEAEQRRQERVQEKHRITALRELTASQTRPIKGAQ